tara:strand:- start:1024 stop:1872 length:849 start_codon:yes stop_codon:yes gene_type:complete
MRYRFLFNFLKVSLATKGVSKINVFLNLAIFLSIFAITSTLISIYYESKITDIEKKISKNDITLDILSLNTMAIPGKVLGLENISNDVKKNNDIINYLYFSKIGQLFDEYELYYRPVINLSNYLSNNFTTIKLYEDIVNSKDEWVIKNLDQEIFKDLKKNSNNHEEFSKIMTQIRLDHENMGLEKGVKVIKPEILQEYQNYYEKFVIFINDQLLHYASISGSLQTIHNNIKNDNLKLFAEISKNSKESKRFVLFAFFFQLIIFIIVQAMEIITTRREIQKIK